MSAVCEVCWREAVWRHNSGDGDGESVTAIYEQLVEADWCCSTEDGHRATEDFDDDPDPIDPTHPGWKP